MLLHWTQATAQLQQTINLSSPIYGLAVGIIGSGAPGETTNQLWVADATSLNVFVNKKLIGSLQVPGGPQYISIPPGFTAYVTTRQGSVYAVDLTSRKLSPALISGGSFGPMDYNAYTSEVYIPDMLNKQVDVLSPIFPGTNTLPREPNYSIHLGVVPQSIAITSDGQLGFIALAGGNIAMLDIPGKQIINTILVGGNPRFIITGLISTAHWNNSPAGFFMGNSYQHCSICTGDWTAHSSVNIVSKICSQ